MEIPTTRRGLSLVGLRGTGKSTVGRLLAERLGRPFADTDDQIVAIAGRPIADIFARQGEGRFRDYEEEALNSLEGRPGAIVATGGGIVLRAANRRRLRAHGFVAWLTADPATLADRLRADPEGLHARPALTAAGVLEELAEILAARTPLYREVADTIVVTDGRPAERVADEVLRAWSAGANGGGRS